MTRAEFLRRLSRGLQTLPLPEREAILADYERYFADGAEAGRHESEVAESLGTPTRLAAELRLAHDMNAWSKSGGARFPWRATKGLLALSLLEGLVWLPACIVVLLLVLALGAGFFAALYGIFTLTFEPFDEPLGGLLAVLLRGVALLTAGAALLLLSNAGIYALSALIVRARRDRGGPLHSTEVSS